MQKRKNIGRFVGAGVLVLLLLALWFIRPLGIIHGPLLWLYQYPLLWMLPLLTGVIIALVTAALVYLRGAKGEESGRWTDYGYRHRSTWEKAGITGLILVPISFVLALIVAPVLTGQAIYNHYGPFEKTALPKQAETRIMPKGVAGVLARNGFSSPTETLENNHIIQTDRGLQWTFGQSPDGAFRRITKKTAGSASLDANSTSRNLRLYKGEFRVAPGHVWADGVTWKAYKKNFWSSVAESVYLPDSDGGKILVPYIKYKGFFVKVPVLGGAYLFSPDGSMEDLSPEEAEAHPDIQKAGRLFPSELARRIQDSFVYVRGISNRMFAHREILTVEDRTGDDVGEDGNKQPHYISVDGTGEWVSVGEPWGRADAVGGVFLTDAMNGKTRLWRTDPSAGLTSSRRAQDATEALAIPGISFQAGDFRAIEPRPVFRKGELFFLVSIVPQASSTVSKSVIIDPRTNKAIAIFSHADDKEADARLLKYLAGDSVQDELSSESDKNKVAESGLTGDESAAVRELIRQNEEQRRALESLLERLNK
jgi:hypothetical protein